MGDGMWGFPGALYGPCALNSANEARQLNGAPSESMSPCVRIEHGIIDTMENDTAYQGFLRIYGRIHPFYLISKSMD